MQGRKEKDTEKYERIKEGRKENMTRQRKRLQN